jgi:hypothetical protein
MPFTERTRRNSSPRVRRRPRVEGVALSPEFGQFRCGSRSDPKKKSPGGFEPPGRFQIRSGSLVTFYPGGPAAPATLIRESMRGSGFVAACFVSRRGMKPPPSTRARDEYHPHRRGSPKWEVVCFVQVAIDAPVLQIQLTPAGTNNFTFSADGRGNIHCYGKLSRKKYRMRAAQRNTEPRSHEEHEAVPDLPRCFRRSSTVRLKMKSRIQCAAPPSRPRRTKTASCPS